MKRRTLLILLGLVAFAPASSRGSCSRDGLSLRGDVDCDGDIDLTDPIVLVAHLFLGRDPPSCPDAADANDDGRVTISDVVDVLAYLFAGRESIPTGQWARDPTPDSLGCSTGRPPCPLPVVPHRVGTVHCQGCLDQPSGIVVSR
jgi:hypothetical protein